MHRPFEAVRPSLRLALGGVALLSTSSLIVGCSSYRSAERWEGQSAERSRSRLRASDGLAAQTAASEPYRPATPAPREPRAAGVEQARSARRDERVETERSARPTGVIVDPAGTNGFADPTDAPTSTFAIDVDTASYTHARAFLDHGALPPRGAIRVEEVVNYFRAGYPQPGPGQPALALNVDGMPSPFGGGRQLVRVGLQARRVSRAARREAGLVFVIDTSGSMAEGGRLEQVKEALRLLVNDLRPTDAVGVVAFDTTAEVVLEPTQVSDKERILDAIDELAPGGSTNLGAGLDLGYRAASAWYRWPDASEDEDEDRARPDRLCRVILCTDGVANTGATAAEAILGRVRRHAADGITLTAIGVGLGQYNDALLERLADDGDGKYAYVDSAQEARRVFVAQTEGTLEVVARDAKVQVEFDPDAVARYRLLGYEDRALADDEFRDDRIDGGEVGAGHSVTALYEVELVPGADGDHLLTARARWQDPDTRAPAEVALELERGDLVRLDDAPPRLRLAAAAARFAEVLRGSAPARDLRRVARVLGRVERDLEGDAAVAELSRLVATASRLGATPREEDDLAAD